MKTYQDYYDEWQNSTESRDLAFDEWLMLQIDRKEKEMIDKAKEAFNKTCGWLAVYPWYNEVVEEFIKAMEE